MARSRNIKPSFFVNDELGQIDPLGRLLFIGLWALADREGRLEDRPTRVKVTVLPYDNCEVNDLLNDLSAHGFIQRYEVDNIKYIQIVNFEKHQNPHKNEQQSTIPAPDNSGASTVQAPEQHGATRADSLLLIPDSLNPLTDSLSRSNGFDHFWKIYPKKVKKKTSLGIWKRKITNGLGERIIQDVHNRLKNDGRWLAGFPPDPTTYLTQERWNDELTPVAKQTDNPCSNQEWQRWGEAHGCAPNVGESMDAYVQRMHGEKARQEMFANAI